MMTYRHKVSENLCQTVRPEVLKLILIAFDLYMKIGPLFGGQVGILFSKRMPNVLAHSSQNKLF